jgi:hypothetical protein
MAKAASRRPTRALIRGITTPNQLTEPITAEHLAALAATCKFLGKTFETGETINYGGSEWQCTAGAWQKVG